MKDIQELIQRQKQIVVDLQEECLQGKRMMEDSLRDAIAGLDMLLKMQHPQPTRPEPSLPVNVPQPVTFGLGK